MKMRLGITNSDIAKAEKELIDIGFGNPKNLSNVPCHHCNGTGKKSKRQCEYCNGLGERYVVRFPTDEMDLFDGRIYETLEYIIDEEKARALLDNKTFDAIFIPNKIDKVDVRPKAEMIENEFDE
jgi:RecJ-like exonuclease